MDIISVGEQKMPSTENNGAASSSASKKRTAEEAIETSSADAANENDAEEANPNNEYESPRLAAKSRTNGKKDKTFRVSGVGKKRSADEMWDVRKASVPKKMNDEETAAKIDSFLKSRCRRPVTNQAQAAAQQVRRIMAQGRHRANKDGGIDDAHYQHLAEEEDSEMETNKKELNDNEAASASYAVGEASMEDEHDGDNFAQPPNAALAGRPPAKLPNNAANISQSAIPPAAQTKKKGTKRTLKPAPIPGAKPGDDGLFLPLLQRTKNGDTPYGRIRSCMCSKPSACRDIMWRWARLKEAKYISYLNIPRSDVSHTSVGKHINIYRNAVLRHMGYNLETMEIMRTIRYKNGREVTKVVKLDQGMKKTSGMEANVRCQKRIASVHFHPDVYYSYLGKNVDLIKGGKGNRWRIPVELGERIGLGEEDKCPTVDSNGQSSYFAVPNYSLEDALADVERAEAEYKRKFKEFKEMNERVTTEMVNNPTKFVLEMHDLKQQVATLTNENDELKEKMKAKTVEQTASDKESEKLQRGLEQMARRLDKWESTSLVGRRLPRCTARDIYKEATGHDLDEEGYYRVAPSGCTPHSGLRGGQDGNESDDSGKKADGRGGHRWSDPRMDRAVQATWDEPSLAIEDALRIGGFEFPELGVMPEGISEKDIMDSDNISLAQRKNNLRRRLRQRKKEWARRGLGDPWVSKSNKDPRMDRAELAKWDDPSLSTAEALRIGGFEWEDQKGVLQKLIMVDGISLDDRKRSVLRRLRVRKKLLAENGSEQPTEEDTERAEEASYDDPDDARTAENIQMATVEEFV